MKTMIAAVLAAGVAVAGCGTVRNMVTAEILTCGEFHSIQEGMHFSEVKEILDRSGSLVAASRYAATRRWATGSADDYAAITVSFDEDSLCSRRADRRTRCTRW